MRQTVGIRGEILRQIDYNRTTSTLLLASAAMNASIIAAVVGILAGNVTAALLVVLALVLWVLLAYGVIVIFAPRGLGGRLPMRAQEARVLPIVERLAQQMSMSVPRVVVLDDPAANALSFEIPGRGSLVAFTTGLLDLLDNAELEGVAAHELAHIANRDAALSLFSLALLGWALTISTVVTVVALAIALFGIGALRAKYKETVEVLTGIIIGISLISAAIMLWALVQVWFIITRLAHLGVSRQREWLADATAAYVTGRPLALASALEKLADTNITLQRTRLIGQSLCLVGEMRRGSWWQDIFCTHPDVYRRIERLRSFISLSSKEPSISPMKELKKL
jgi:heat shock protein HtpX